MRRKLAFYALAVCAGLLLAVLAAVVVLRATVLEAVLERQLAQRGFPDARLEVERVGLGSARITGIRLEPSETLSVESVTASYTLNGLVDRRLDHITVEGVDLRLDLMGAGPPLGPLQPLIGGDGGSPALPPIALRRIRLRAATPAGPVALDLDGRMSPEADGHATVSGTLEAPRQDLSGRFEATVAPLAGDPRLVLSEAELRAGTPLGPVDARLVGEVAPEGGGSASLNATVSGLEERLSGRLRVVATSLTAQPAVHLPEIALRLDTAAGPVTADLRGDVMQTADGGRAVLRGSVQGPADSVRAELDASAAPLSRTPEFRLDLEATANADSPVWSDLRLPAPAAGRAAVTARLRGRVPPNAPGAQPTALLRAAADAGIAGRLQVNLEDVAEPEVVDGLSASLAIGLDAREGALAIRLAEPATVRPGQIAVPALAAMGLPPAAVEAIRRVTEARLTAWTDAGEVLELRGRGDGLTITGRGTARLAFPDGTAALSANGTADLSPALSLRRLALDTVDLNAENLRFAGHRLNSASASGWLEGPAESLAGELDLRLALARLGFPGMRIGDVSVAAPVALTLEDGGRTAVTLRRPARVELGKMPDMGTVAFTGPVRLDVTRGRVERGADGDIVYDAAAEPAALGLELRRRDTDPLPLEVSPGRLTVQGRMPPDGDPETRIGASGFGASAPSLDIAADGVSATVGLRIADTPLARVEVTEVRSTARPALFAPMTASLTANRRDGAIAAKGELGPVGRDVRASLDGTHDPGTASGRLDIDIPDIRFAPNALQPRHLSPLLANVDQASGTLAARAQVTWTPDGLDSRGVVRLDGLRFRTAQATVEGLSGEVVFDRLVPPPSTPPAQHLTAARVVAGVPLTEADVRLRLERSEGTLPTLHVEHAESGFGGGKLLLDDARFAPAEPEQAFAVQVEGLDLAVLFEQLAVEGLSGTGKLSGRIPVRWTGSTVVVESGRLEAEGDGVLSYRSEAAERALASGGEQVQLMLRALRDFRYEELSVTVSRSAEGQLDLAVSTLGHNPDVLDGYPFRFNITLSGDIDPLLRALAEGRRLTGEVLRRAWELRQ